MAAKTLVEFGGCSYGGRGADTAGDTSGNGTKLEVALVRIFIAAGIEPGIEIRIGDGFFSLMGNGVDHAIGPADVGRRTIGTSALSLTARRAFVHVADEGVLDVRAVDGGMSMEPAVGAAEP